MKILKIIAIIFVCSWIYSIFTGSYLDKEEEKTAEPPQLQNIKQVKPVEINIEDTIFTILYNYEPFGFYVIKTEDDILQQPRYGLHLIEELMPYLAFGSENNTILVNIFDKIPNIQSIANAKKTLPADLLFKSTTQLPYAEITFMNGIGVSVCNYKKETNSSNSYFISKAYTEWQMKTDDDTECMGSTFLKLQRGK